MNQQLSTIYLAHIYIYTYTEVTFYLYLHFILSSFYLYLHHKVFTLFTPE